MSLIMRNIKSDEYLEIIGGSCYYYIDIITKCTNDWISDNEDIALIII